MNTIDKKIDISVVNSINKKINSTMPLATLLTSIMDAAAQLLNTEGSSLLLNDRKTGDLIFNVVIGNKGNIIIGEKVPKGKGIAGSVAESGKPLIVNDVTKDPTFFPFIDKKSEFVTRNILAVPMMVMNDLVGVLEIVNTRGRDAFDDWDLECAMYLADHAAIAIASRRLYDDLNRRIEELTALYEVSQAISVAEKDDGILVNVIGSLAKSMSVEKASIIIFDDRTQTLRIQAFYGLPASVKIGYQVDMKSSIAGHVFRSGDPMIVSDINEEIPMPMRSCGRKYDTESFISLPIMYHNKTIGILSLTDRKSGKTFDSFDLRVLSTVTSQIAEVYQNIQNRKNIESQKRLEREIEIASDIQKKILSDIPTSFGSHRMAAYNKPAKVVGGDFYDSFAFDGHRYAVLVADVSGKGIPAALFMGSARNIVRAERRIEQTPARLMKNVNNLIYEDSEYGMFVTMFYALIDTQNRLITYASAGHNNQLMLKEKTKEILTLNASGKALGLLKNEEFEEKIISYSDGDMLLLFTDGVIEYLADEGLDIDQGEGRLAKIAFDFIDRSPEDLINHLKEISGSEKAETSFSDDFTVFVIKF